MGLTLFAEVGCAGTSKEIKDSEVNLAKVGVKFGVKVLSHFIIGIFLALSTK